MPRKSPLVQKEAQEMFYSMMPPEIKVAIEEAYRVSQEVTVRESNFLDDGPDFIAFLIDGDEVYRKEGY